MNTTESQVMAERDQERAEARAARQGEAIAQLLQLREARDENGKRYTPKRYATTWGSKTAVGIYNTVETIAEMMKKGEAIKP